MANRKLSMVMSSDPYVDRRIKIFQLNRQGPKFDVKKIAARLRAEMPAKKPTQPLPRPQPLNQKKQTQTKSEFINSIKIKSVSVPVRLPEVKLPSSSPVECLTILDSSDEENDNDLSITCNIQVKALLSPEQTHSFYVPVDIPCRQESRRTLYTKTVTPKKARYSAKNIPPEFECFVRLERLSEPAEDPPKIPVSQPVDKRVDDLSSSTTLDVKEEPASAPGSRVIDDETTTTYTNVPLGACPAKVDTPQPQPQPPKSSNECQIIESSFDIKVERIMHIPTIETPPPDPSPMMQGAGPNQPQEIPTVLPIKIAPAFPTPDTESPPPIVAKPSTPPRPVIKLRNINELLEFPVVNQQTAYVIPYHRMEHLRHGMQQPLAIGHSTIHYMPQQGLPSAHHPQLVPTMTPMQLSSVTFDPQSPCHLDGHSAMLQHQLHIGNQFHNQDQQYVAHHQTSPSYLAPQPAHNVAQPAQTFVDYQATQVGPPKKRPKNRIQPAQQKRGTIHSRQQITHVSHVLDSQQQQYLMQQMQTPQPSPLQYPFGQCLPLRAGQQ